MREEQIYNEKQKKTENYTTLSQGVSSLNLKSLPPLGGGAGGGIKISLF